MTLYIRTFPPLLVRVTDPEVSVRYLPRDVSFCIFILHDLSKEYHWNITEGIWSVPQWGPPHVYWIGLFVGRVGHKRTNQFYIHVVISEQLQWRLLFYPPCSARCAYLTFFCDLVWCSGRSSKPHANPFFPSRPDSPILVREAKVYRRDETYCQPPTHSCSCCFHKATICKSTAVQASTRVLVQGTDAR